MIAINLYQRSEKRSHIAIAKSRFWNNVQRMPGDGCWLWSGPRLRNGFRFSFPGGSTRAVYAVAWMLEHGRYPKHNMKAACGQAACCRPSHRTDRRLARGIESWEQHFWKRVNKTESCWLWTGHIGSYGYGSLHLSALPGAKYKYIGAHRFSWILAHGEISDPALQVCHSCDNPPCVNPAHLFLGTNRQNMEDRSAKGRQPRGIRNGRAILSEADVLAIREHAGKVSNKELALRYGVKACVISSVILRRSWKHL